jgi:hypothetical protein
VTIPDGPVHYAVTRPSLVEALRNVPLTGSMHRDALVLMADSILGQMPVVPIDADSYEEGVGAERERAALLAEEHGVSYARNIPGGEFEYWSFADLIRQEPQP